jgi:8-oxo-dGTP pyrophosphatase MutT (NUDIX family)
MAAMDYELLRSEDTWRGRHLALRRETYRMPDGGQFGPVSVLDFRDWANALALTPDGQAVLVKQFRPGSKAVTLELPGGTVEDGEGPIENTMRRELEEETGYGGGRLTYLGHLSPNSATNTNRVHSFLMQDVTPVAEQHTDDGELIEVVLLPLPEVVALARSGGLDQAMHVATLFLALANLDLRGLLRPGGGADLGGLPRVQLD